jgi:hypothetical protein
MEKQPTTKLESEKVKIFYVTKINNRNRAGGGEVGATGSLPSFNMSPILKMSTRHPREKFLLCRYTFYPSFLLTFALDK